MRSKPLILLTAFSFALAAGCARLSNESTVYRTSEKSAIADSEAARYHEAAIGLMNQGAYDAAEQELQNALVADVNYGPAHNTLGKLYYDQQKFYLASWEFEHAAKAMPNRAEPHNNLGLVYESVEKQELAIAAYEVAVALAPQNSNYLGNLIRAKVRRGDLSQELVLQLREFIHLDSRHDWTEWAKLQLIKQEDDRVGLRAGELHDESTSYLDGSWIPNGEHGTLLNVEEVELPLETGNHSTGKNENMEDSSRRDLPTLEFDGKEQLPIPPASINQSQFPILNNEQSSVFVESVESVDTGFEAISGESSTALLPVTETGENMIRLTPIIIQ